MEPTGGFAMLAARLTGLLVTVATPLGLLWLGWGTLKAVLTGSTDRALQTLVVRGLILAVLIGVLNNLPSTFGVLTDIGEAILHAVLDGVRGAF